MLAILLPWAFVHLVLLMHAPGSFGVHLLWLWGLIAFVSLVTLASAAVHGRGVATPARAVARREFRLSLPEWGRPALSAGRLRVSVLPGR